MGEAARQTELIALDGKTVDNIPLHHDFNAVWVVDTQRLLWRDNSRGHYLVTLTEACWQLAVRRDFSFHQADPRQLRSSRSYEVRPAAGQRCDVAKIEQIDDTGATALREAALRRAC